MNISTKLLKAAAGQAGGAGLDVDEVFSTFVYSGSSSGQTITNNINLSSEGGLVWTKDRTSSSAQHALFDTERGVLKGLASSSVAAEANETGSVTAFNSNGYTLGTWSGVNYSGIDYVSWTFRKAKKFFDCVQYSGTGTAQNISHDLDADVGFLIVKRTDSTSTWRCWHRGLPSGNDVIHINETSAYETSSAIWNGTAPTSTQFSVGTNNNVNASGGSYVAYLFAHHANDGSETGFGPDGDSPVISCGSFTESSSEQEINLGFEPQWLMIKTSSTTLGWRIFDMMRGFGTTSNASLEANSSSAEGGSSPYFKPTPTGFTVPSGFYGSGTNYIYMAIRRGPLAAPTDATKVFAMDLRDDTDAPMYKSGFVTDMSIYREVSASNDWYIQSRLTGVGHLHTHETASENTNFTSTNWDYMNGFYDAGSINSAYQAWMWKRAPSYFDVITWKVDGTGDQTINHNLGVVPEMIWSKNRNDSGSGSGDWWVAHKDLTGWDSDSQNDRHTLKLNSNAASAQQGYHRDFTSTSIRLLGNAAGGYTTTHNCIAYLFATVAGVSKVGSYTGTGAQQNIDCGFSSGARFVLIKKADDTGHWQIYDTTRGLVSGNDPRLALNLTSAELTGYDMVDPYSSGFAVTDRSDTNDNGYTYIFYAIA